MKKEPFIAQSEERMSIPVWEALDDRIHAGISTRNGGVSGLPYDSLNLGLHVGDRHDDVIQNRLILGNQIGDLDQWVVGEQVHGTTIKEVKRSDRGQGTRDLESAVKGVDGLYTRDLDVVLTAFYADCVPLYFFAPDHQLVGIAHAGWKGTVGGMASKFVETWKLREKVAPENIQAAIGPSIGACCYEVDERVIRKVNEMMPHPETPPYANGQEGRYMLDLKLLNKQVLIQTGVPEGNISVSQYCTSCHNKLFFSHRRDEGESGRMLGFIVLKEV